MISIETYAGELIQEMKTYLKKSAVDQGEEQLHHLRVSLKKTNALLHLLSHCREKCPEHIRKLDRIFKRAGKIRDLQLIIPDLKHKLPRRLRQHRLIKDLDRTLENRLQRFSRHYKKYRKEIIRKIERKIYHCLSGEEFMDLAGYFSMMKSRITNATKQRLENEDQIHQLRKDIKTFNYNLVLGGHILKRNEIDGAHLSDREQLLGDWHNAVQAAEYIERLTFNAPPEMRPMLERIREKYLLIGASFLKRFNKLPTI